MIVNELASAIYNDVVAGLVGIVANPTISMEQLEQDVVDQRLALIKLYSLKNLLPVKDLMLAINCVELDCQSMDKCCNSSKDYSKPVAHFEIPQLVNDFGDDAIQYIGPTDKSGSFMVYTNVNYKYHKTRKRGGDKPYVYIDTTPNSNNMYDCYLFNAPFLKRVSVVGIFKDLRQVEDYSCCLEDLRNMSFLDAEIKANVTKMKLTYYRSNYVAPQPNNQVPR